MKIDVTNTQTGNDPEVHQISKDVDRFDENIKLPTDPPVKSSGPAAVAGKSVDDAVAEAAAETKADLGSEIETAESVVKGQEDVYQHSTESIKTVNQDYWNKIYNHISGLNGFDKSIGVQDFIDRAQGDDDYIKSLRKKLRRSTYNKPVDFTLGKSDEEFKSNLFSEEGVLDYSKVATGVLEQEFKPSVSKSKLEGDNSFKLLAAPSGQPTSSGMMEFERVKSIIDGTVPKIETQEVKQAWSDLYAFNSRFSQGRNPLYEGEDMDIVGEAQLSDNAGNAHKILTMESISPTKFGDKTYAENHDPLVAFGLTKEVLYKKTKSQDDLMLQTEDSEKFIDELSTFIENKAWKSAEYLNTTLKYEYGVTAIDASKTREVPMALNPETGDFYNPKGEKLKEGYEEVMMTGNEVKLRRVIRDETKKLASARSQMSNLAFGSSGEVASEEQVRYGEIKLSMKEDRQGVSGLSGKLDEYEEMYRSSKGGSGETTENWKRKFLMGSDDMDWDEQFDIRVSEEDKEKYNDYLNIIENKVDQEIKIDKDRRELKAPGSIKTFDGYYAYVNKVTEDMGAALVPWQQEYNESSFIKVKNNIETFNDGLYEQKKVEFDRVNKNIESKYQSQYDKVSDTDPDAIAITEKYRALYAEAITDEAKAEVHSAYNEELMAVPMMAAVAKQHRQAIDLVQNELENKYSKASRDHFGSVMKAQTEAYQRDAANYVRERFIDPVNEDLGVKSFIHNEMEINPDFNNLSYRDKKAAIDVLWGKWKGIIVSQHNSERKKIPLNREEAKLPAYKWTGTADAKAGGDNLALIGSGFGGFEDGEPIWERTGDDGYREFLFHAMSSTMFEGATQKASVFQVKSWAESMEKEVDLEVKRLERQYQKIRETDINGTGVDREKPFDEDGATNPDFKSYYGEIHASESKKKDLIELKETIAEIINHPEQDENFFSEFAEGLYGGDFEEYVPFLATLVDIGKNLSLYNISEKMQNKRPLDFGERIMMDSYSGLQKINELKPRSAGYRWGSGVKDMVPYVGEFALTMGTFTAGKAATKKALTTMFKKGIDRGVKKQALLTTTGKGIAKGWEGVSRESITLMGEKMIDGLSYTMGAFAQATVNPQMTTNHIIERMTPESQFMLSGNGEEIYTQISGKGEDFGEAFFKAYGLTFSEMFSEQLGMHLMKLPKGALKQLAGNPEWVKRTIIGGWMRTKGFVKVSDATKYIVQNKLGWSGVMGEYSEEFVNGRMSSLITGDRGVWDIDAQQELDTFMTVVLGGSHMTVISLAGTRIKRIGSNSQVVLEADVVNNSGYRSVVSESFSPSVWKQFNKFLGKPGVHPTQLKDMLGTFEDLTKKQRDVLGAIYVKAKGKDIINSENYETVKADLEKTTGREINDEWLRNDFELPAIEKGATDGVGTFEGKIDESLEEDTTIEELNKVTEETNEKLKEPTPIKIGSIAQEETKENVKEEVTPEEEVVETPVEGEQQVTKGVGIKITNEKQDPNNKYIKWYDVEVTDTQGATVPFNKFTLEIDESAKVASVMDINKDFGKGDKNKGIGKSAYIQLAKDLGSKGIRLKSSGNLSEGAVKMWNSLVKEGLAESFETGSEVTPNSYFMYNDAFLPKNKEGVREAEAQEGEQQATESVGSYPSEEVYSESNKKRRVLESIQEERQRVFDEMTSLPFNKKRKSKKSEYEAIKKKEEKANEEYNSAFEIDNANQLKIDNATAEAQEGEQQATESVEEEVPFPEEEKKAPVKKPKTKKKLQIAKPYVKGEGRNQKLVIEDAMKPNPTRRGKYQKLSAYEKAIEKGEMTYEEAKAAIESIGLEVPENISRLDPTKETETKETKTEKETKEEPIGYEEMVEVEPGKFVPKSTLPTFKVTPPETKETETKPTIKGEKIEVEKEDKDKIIAWTKSTPEERKNDKKIGRAKQSAIKSIFGIVSPEVRKRVAEILGVSSISRRAKGEGTVKGLNAIASEHIKDSKTLNEVVKAVGLAKAEEKAAVAEAKAAKEKAAPERKKKVLKETIAQRKAFDDKIREGEEHRKNKDYDKAKESYKEAIKIAPNTTRQLEAQEKLDIVSNNTLDTSLDTSKEKNTKETEKEKKAKARGQKIRNDASNLGIDYATDERVSSIQAKVEEKVDTGKKYGEEGFNDDLKEAKNKVRIERNAQKDFNNSVKNGVLPIKETDMGKESLEQAITMQQNKVDEGGKPSDVKINGRGVEHSISAQIKQAFKDKKITAAQQKALLKKAKAVTDNYKDKQAEQKRLEEEGEGSLIERKVSEQRKVGGIIDSMLGPIVEKLQKVFPKIEVYATEKDYEKGTKEAGWSKKRRDNNIAFFDRENFKIYLNPKKATADTAMEEFAHLWTTIAKLKAGGIYGTGISLVEGSVYVDMALEEQPDLAHKDKDGNIVVSEELLHEALGKAIKDGGAKLGAKKNKFREAVRKIFRYVGRLLGISPSINIANTTLEEFTAIAQGELLAGKKITNASSETLSKGMDFKISNSILAKRGFWGKRKSWWNAWAKERKGINKKLYDEFGKSEGLIKSWQRESQDVWNEFQSELNNYLTASFPTGFLKKGFKGKVKEYINSKKYKEAKENIKKRKKIWNAVGNALNTHEGIEEVPEELKESVRALKTHISDLGDKIISLYRKLGEDVTGLEASFDEKRGIYIHRTYEKHAVADWHKKYEDRFTEEEIIAAKNEIHKIYESNNVKSVEWKRTAGNEIELYFTSTKGVVGKSSVGGPIGESIKVKQKNLRGFLNEMFTEKVADKLTEDINRSFASTEGFNTWTFPKPVKSSHPQVNFRKTDGEVINILEDLLDRDNAEASVDLSKKMGNTVRKGDKAILRKRKDIPKALRVIYGEYTDPYINFTKTTQRINSLLAKTELEAELLRQGEGSLFTKNKDKVTNNIEIKKNKSSLLGGMYTTPEMHALLFDKDGGLMSMFSPNFIAEGKSKTVNNAAVPVLYKMLNAQTKASLTVMNPSGQSRNMLSAILFLTQNGHLPIHLLEATRIIKSDMNAAELITGSIMNPYLGALSVITWGQDIAYGKLGNSMGWKQPEKQTKEAIKKEVIRAAKNRLLDESAEAGVIDELVNSIYSAGSGVNIAEKVKIWTAKTYAKGIKAFSKPYQSTDAIFKISQWQQEVKTQEDIYGADKTQEEKEDAATDLVRSEQPTYSQQASIFKALSKNIFLSTFISFDIQTWRNRYNIIANSARFRKEAMKNTTLAEQYKSKGDNANYEKHKLRAKKLNNQAKRRVAGFFLTAVLLKGAAEYSKYLFSISDDDEENLAIASGADYNKYNAKIFTSGDLRKNQHYDMAFVDPWSNFWRPITAASRGDDTLDGILNAAGEVVAPYLAREVLWAKVQEAIAGFNSKGEEITNEQMSPYHRISRPLFHALSALEPGIWRDGKDITDDLLFSDPTDHKGSTKKAGVVFWNAMLGVKEKETDVLRSYSFKRFHEHKAVDNILQNHKDGIETGSDTKAYLDGAWGVMKKEYDAMIGLGFSRSEIMKSYGYTDSEGKKHKPNSTKVKMLTEVANGRKWKLNEEKSTLILPKKGRSYFTKEEMGISNSQLGIPNIKNQIKIK